MNALKRAAASEEDQATSLEIQEYVEPTPAAPPQEEPDEPEPLDQEENTPFAAGRIFGRGIRGPLC